MACWCDSGASEDEHCVCWWVLGSGIEFMRGKKMMSAAKASFLLVPPLWSGLNTTNAWCDSPKAASAPRRSEPDLWTKSSELPPFRREVRSVHPVTVNLYILVMSPFPGGAEIKQQICWSKSHSRDIWSSKGLPHLTVTGRNSASRETDFLVEVWAPWMLLFMYFVIVAVVFNAEWTLSHVREVRMFCRSCSIIKC